MILPGPRCKQTEPGRKHQVQREHAVAGRVGKVGSIKPAGPAGTRGLSRGPDWELMGGPPPGLAAGECVGGTHEFALRRDLEARIAAGRWEKFRWVESRGGMEGGHDDSSYGSLRGHVGTVLTRDVPPLGGRGADGVLEVPVVRRRALALRGSRSVPQWSGGSPGSPGQRWGGWNSAHPKLEGTSGRGAEQIACCRPRFRARQTLQAPPGQNVHAAQVTPRHPARCPRSAHARLSATPLAEARPPVVGTTCCRGWCAGAVRCAVLPTF